MKKTLIALLALGSVAMADTTLEWNLTSTSSTSSTNNCNAYGLVFDINAGTVNRKEVNEIQGYTYSEQDVLTLQTITLGTTATSADSVNFALLGNLTGGADGTTSTGNILGFLKGDSVTVENGVATLDFSSQGITMTQNSQYRLFFTTKDYSDTEVGTQITLADKTSFNMTGYTAGVSGDRVHLGFLGSGLGPGLNQSWTPVVSMALTSSVPGPDPVPEPATGSLSLLALAGLAARRRRK